MPLFDIFSAPVYHDEAFGDLKRTSGYWRGRMTLGAHQNVPLLISGSRTQPDAAALAIARELPLRYPAQQAAIAAELFEHHLPYRDAIDAGEMAPKPGTDIHMTTPQDVWPRAEPVQVVVAPVDGRMTVEIAYSVAWDIEHTLGARLVDWSLVELNGSVRVLAR